MTIEMRNSYIVENIEKITSVIKRGCDRKNLDFENVYSEIMERLILYLDKLPEFAMQPSMSRITMWIDTTINRISSKEETEISDLNGISYEQDFNEHIWIDHIHTKVDLTDMEEKIFTDYVFQGETFDSLSDKYHITVKKSRRLYHSARIKIYYQLLWRI